MGIGSALKKAVKAPVKAASKIPGVKSVAKNVPGLKSSLGGQSQGAGIGPSPKSNLMQGLASGGAALAPGAMGNKMAKPMPPPMMQRPMQPPGQMMRPQGQMQVPPGQMNPMMQGMAGMFGRARPPQQMQPPMQQEGGPEQEMQRAQAMEQMGQAYGQQQRPRSPEEMQSMNNMMGNQMAMRQSPMMPQFMQGQYRNRM